MAFIRKHRLMLVPVFVAMLGAVGLVFLLPSGSDEPTYPREVSVEWVENMAKRSQHGREFRVVRTMESIDPVTEEVVTEECVSTVREVGTNTCYQDGEGQWLPSVAEWESGATGFMMDKNNWQIEVGSTLGAAYQYTVGDETLSMRPSVLVLSDGVHTVTLGTIDSNIVGAIDESDASKLVFADILGANSGIDIELVIEKAALHQNVIVRTKPTLPQGFDAEDARLYIYTEMGLDALVSDPDVGVKLGETAVNVSASDLATVRNAHDAIAVTKTETVGGQVRERVLHRFVESKVWDETGVENETCAARQLWRHPVSSKTYLVESVPYSYIDDADGVVTIDYSSVNGTLTDDDVWTADATYWVTDDVTVGAHTLTIEPGTIVKFDGGKKIELSDASSTIIARGEPYKYIVFTSDTDDLAGEDLTGGSTSGSRSYYSCAIEIDDGASSDSVIAYCKIGYAVAGLRVGVDLSTPIQHCIVYDCYTGINPCRVGSTGATGILNCLVRKCYAGISVWLQGDLGSTPTFSIYNCTMAEECNYGVLVNIYDYDTDGAEITIKNCLFTTHETAGIAVASTMGTGDYTQVTWDIDYNAFYDTDDPEFLNIGVEEQGGYIELNVSPYDTTKNQLGTYYIDTEDDPYYQYDGSNLVNAGYGVASTYYDDAALFSIEAPDIADATITETPKTWEPRDGDTGTVDIGYHHPRVDYVINNIVSEISGGAQLDIEPGTVVAFYGTSGRLQFDEDAMSASELECDGEPDDYIVLAAEPVVSMDVEAQVFNGGWTYNVKGIRLNDPSSATATASITYTRFMGFDKGLAIEKDSEGEVCHCTFERSEVSFYTNGTGGRTIEIANCLFYANRRGISAWLNDDEAVWQGTNCTFDKNEIGLVISTNDLGTVIITDSLFTGGDNGIQINQQLGTFTEHHNAFWDNDSYKIYQNYGTPAAITIDDDSIDLEADPYDSDWFDDEDPASADWTAQWYLDQDGECIDAGSRSAYAAMMATSTTRLSDSDYDYGRVDIGYHYPTDLFISDTHFDNEAGGGAGEIDIFYDYGETVSSRIIRIYNDIGDLVYEYTPAGDDSTISLDDWDGTGNQTGYSGDLDTGVYVIVILGNSTEYTRFRIYIEQSGDAALEIQRPDDNETIDWL